MTHWKFRSRPRSDGGVVAARRQHVGLSAADGLNNQPEPQATADLDLQTKISDLLADGIPVYATCTGSDRGPDPQCAEIAIGTGGHYVDSDSAARLPEVLVGFHERIAGGELISSF